MQIRQKENRLLPWNGIHNLDGISRGTKDIALGFHLNRRVDVADNGVVRMFTAELANGFNRATLHQAAARLAVGDHDDALRVEHLGSLGHEPYAAESDHITRELARFASQFQAIADDIGEL